MNLKHLLATTSLIAMSNSALAAPFMIYDARSAGMGGTGVASAQISAAPFFNPAMLAAQREEEDFSLLLGVGAAAQDNNKLLDDIEAFTNAYDASNAVAAQNALTSAIGKQLSIQGNANIGVGVAGDTWSFAVSGNGYIQANVSLANDLVTPVQPLTADLVFTGIEVSEYGFSLARKFGNLSIGLTPKVQSITSYDARADIASNDQLDQILDVVTSIGQTDHGTNANLDVGLVYKLTENWKVGAVMRNALSEDYTTVASTKITLDPQTRAGIAYTGDFLTLAVDYDLMENDPIIAGGEKTQMLSAGVEFDVLDFMQLRAGMSQNTANSASEDTYSLGIGFTIIAAQLDIAAVGNDNSASIYAQFGVRW